MANTLAAVEAGATHVQGTANGYGERAGNANIFSVIGGLVTKMGYDVLPDGCLAEMFRVSHAIAEIANLAPDGHAPYVGASAFAHKAGLHASAIKVSPQLYNHLDPDVVGNGQRILVTEMAGRASVELKSMELGIDVGSRPDVVATVVDRVKEREASGWSYEAADASFELLVRDELGTAPRQFTVESYRVIIDRREDGALVSEATVKVHAGGRRVISTEEGNGPVNALDRALRAALGVAYPRLADFELTDYKVRILPGKHGTDAVTRVLVQTSDQPPRMDHRRRARERRRGVVAGAVRRGALRPLGRAQAGRAEAATGRARSAQLGQDARLAGVRAVGPPRPRRRRRRRSWSPRATCRRPRGRVRSRR